MNPPRIKIAYSKIVPFSSISSFNLLGSTTYILGNYWNSMAKGSKKGGRVRDKWRDKQWVVVNSPSAFASGPINYIPITSIESCKGRVIENTMFDILRQDPTQHQTKVLVQIERV